MKNKITKIAQKICWWRQQGDISPKGYEEYLEEVVNEYKKEVIEKIKHCSKNNDLTEEKLISEIKKIY
jgi:hypothetical protein